ncbi:MAG: hypothetical protein K8T90_09285 [Planctomycetes bacterium]|nr:hypothetical protein [Planctomycetota bacterium]
MTATTTDLTGLRARATTALRALLRDCPRVTSLDVVYGEGVDDAIHARATVAGASKHLRCIALRTAEPRIVRQTIDRELAGMRQRAADAAGLVILAPFISAEAAAICRDAGVGSADFEGNAALDLGAVLLVIDRRAGRRPRRAPREMVSLFAPKSARVLRLMLANPGLPWLVTEMARQAGISLGHASNVRTALLDREWGCLEGGRIRLARPRALLEAWGHVHRLRRPKRQRFHTLLHGTELMTALGAASRVSAAPATGDAADTPHPPFVLSSFSAADDIAPYVPPQGLYVSTTAAGVDALRSGLGLEPSARGPNVIVTVLRDDGALRDAVPTGRIRSPGDPGGVPGVSRTSAVQTWLDLMQEGGRGEEAAQHLLDTFIAPRWPRA